MGQLDSWLGKLEVTNELGEKLDGDLQRAEQVAQHLHGGAAALKSGAEKIGELGTHVSRDLEEGLLEFETPLKAAEYTRKYLTRAREVLLNLAEKSKNEELVAHGKAAGLRVFMGTLQNHAKAAKARTEQLLAAAEEVQKAEESSEKEPDDDAPRRGRVRLPGEHPGRSSLDARRAQRDNQKSAEGDGDAGDGPPDVEKVVTKHKKARKCGACGKVGHTARSCPEKKR